MITAIDSNVLVTLWAGVEASAAVVAELLGEASDQGPLVISPPVYAELVAAPDRDSGFVDDFLTATHIRVDWGLSEDVWRAAAEAFRGYAIRRRVSPTEPGPRRILADFIIGAHAVQYGAALLTFDGGIYRISFPSLVLMPGDKAQVRDSTNA